MDVSCLDEVGRRACSVSEPGQPGGSRGAARHGARGGMAARCEARRACSAPARGSARRRFVEHLHLEDAAAAVLTRTYAVVWQVQLDDWGTWVDFAAQHSERLEAAWEAMASRVELGPRFRPDQWVVDLRQLTQTNQWSGTNRNVRRVLVTNS